jgi:two-component system, NtrC family, response regulator HydG
VLLIDLTWLALNGLEAYLETKAVCLVAVAVIFTAYPQEMHDIAEAALHSSAYACLDKPLDIDRLLDLLQEIVDRRDTYG